MFKSFKKSLCNSKLKEFNKTFTRKDGFDIFEEDNHSSWCSCCEYDDYDYYADDYYENEFEYAMSRTHLFFENIKKLEKFFKSEFLEKLKLNKNVEFDTSEVFFEVKFSDLIDGYNTSYLYDFFDEDNKYGLEITAKIQYKDYDFTQIRSVNISIKNPFIINGENKYRNNYNFNIYYNKHLIIREHSLDFILRRMIKKLKIEKHKFWQSRNYIEEAIPEWCETNEECLMYYLLEETDLNKNVFNDFSVRDIIKNKEDYDVFLMFVK